MGGAARAAGRVQGGTWRHQRAEELRRGPESRQMGQQATALQAEAGQRREHRGDDGGAGVKLDALGFDFDLHSAAKRAKPAKFAKSERVKEFGFVTIFTRSPFATHLGNLPRAPIGLVGQFLNLVNRHRATHYFYYLAY